MRRIGAQHRREYRSRRLRADADDVSSPDGNFRMSHRYCVHNFCNTKQQIAISGQSEKRSVQFAVVNFLFLSSDSPKRVRGICSALATGGASAANACDYIRA